MGAGLTRDALSKPGVARTLSKEAKLILLYFIVYQIGSHLHRQRLSRIRTYGGLLDPTLIRFSANSMQWAAYWGVATAILSATQNVEVKDILEKMFGVGGIAFGFAAQQTISNLISGLMLLLSHPFQIGDHIQVLNSNVINHSLLVARQVIVTVSTSDKEDVKIVRKELKEAVAEADAMIRKRVKDSCPAIALDVKKAGERSLWRAAVTHMHNIETEWKGGEGR
eukprot:jgi/Bigna1/68143/fgenesh1_pg.5_\